MVGNEETIILNRKWIYENPDEDPVASTDFEIPMNYLRKIFPVLFPKEESFTEFLDWYVPEEDGELIYQRALIDGVIVSECIAPC